MILRNEYKEDLKEFIRDTDESVFAAKGLTADEILGDADLMDRLWCIYQKSVEEYDVAPDYAYRGALFGACGIPMPKL